MTTPMKNSTPAASLEDLLKAYTEACIAYGKAAENYATSENYAGRGTESVAMYGARKECEKLRYEIVQWHAAELANHGKETPNAA